MGLQLNPSDNNRLCWKRVKLPGTYVKSVSRVGAEEVLGAWDGLSVGGLEGAPEGRREGKLLGGMEVVGIDEVVGWEDGCNEGVRDGLSDGNQDGSQDGWLVGDPDGLPVGDLEGLPVGEPVGLQEETTVELRSDGSDGEDGLVNDS